MSETINQSSASLITRRFLLATMGAASASSSIALAADATMANVAGSEQFDFFMGKWKVSHQRLKRRLADNHEWIHFSGTSTAHKILGGLGSIDDNMIDMPGARYFGSTIRAYDRSTDQWSEFWLDSRFPDRMDPPVKGRFVEGRGEFLSEDTFEGRPIRVRVIWSHSSADSCRWEQAFSADAGKTWETNWIMIFDRAA